MHQPIENDRFSQRPYGVTESTCQLYGARIASCLAILAFISAYMWGIHIFGLILGMGLGWLPCVVLAWAVVHVVTPFANQSIRYAWTGYRLVATSSIGRHPF